jgi:hypothetical protein
MTHDEEKERLKSFAVQFQPFARPLLAHVKIQGRSPIDPGAAAAAMPVRVMRIYSSCKSIPFVLLSSMSATVV